MPAGVPVLIGHVIELKLRGNHSFFLGGVLLREDPNREPTRKESHLARYPNHQHPP